MPSLQRTKTNDDSPGYVSYGGLSADSTSKTGVNELKRSTHIGWGKRANVLKKRDVGERVQNIVPMRRSNAQQEKVSGTVLKVEDVSVLCEVELYAGHIHINLPRCLFSEEIYYGMPIAISFEEGESGVRKPSVSSRQIDAESLRQENEEMRALVEKL
jgi:hypothetical protein